MVSAAPPASCLSHKCPLSFGDPPSRDARGPPLGVLGLAEVFFLGGGCILSTPPPPRDFGWAALSTFGAWGRRWSGVGFFTSK